MSQDFQLAHTCPHLTVEEHVTLGADRRSMETRQPVAAHGLVRVLINDQFYVPSTGLLSLAQIKGASSGPFHIIANENTLTLTNSGSTYNVTLPLGNRVKADTLVKLIKEAVTGISVVNEGGHLVLTDTTQAGGASLIKVSGTAAGALGFSAQTGARGRTVYPGWRLAKRVDTITNRFPQFISPIKTDPVIKVTYTVPVERCLRCRALGIENDYRFDLSGEPLRIQDENLLYQAALKILLTEKGSNIYHTDYGTSITNLIGSKALGAVTTLLTEEVSTALRNMQRQQQEQGKFQSVSAKERLFRVLSVNVVPDTEDPTIYYVEVVVSNASNEPVNISVVFTVPGAASRLGRSNFFGLR